MFFRTLLTLCCSRRMGKTRYYDIAKYFFNLNARFLSERRRFLVENNQNSLVFAGKQHIFHPDYPKFILCATFA